VPKKEKLGKVVSTLDKTAVVEVAEFRPHAIYKKIIAKTKNYIANDVNNMCVIGDLVRIIESRPISKRKRWSVAEVTEKAT